MALPAPGAGSAAAPLARQWRAPFPVDVRLVLSVHRRGPRDPAYRIGSDGAVWRTSLTPDGPGTLRVTAGPPVAAGPVACPATMVSATAWRPLLLRFGDQPPGPAPAGMRVFPPPRTWLRIPSWEWHRAGVEAVRARTIAGAAQVVGRVEEVVAMAPADADRRLRVLPGVGPWTSAEVRQRACGDADAVSVGDYNLPAAVGWTLARRVVDDTGMLELLEPYHGHRYR